MGEINGMQVESLRGSRKGSGNMSQGFQGGVLERIVAKPLEEYRKKFVEESSTTVTLDHTPSYPYSVT